MSKSRRIHIKSLAAAATSAHTPIHSEPPKAAAITTLNSTSSMDSHYAVGTGGSAVKRIRTPLKHDVLCGRGGGINSHGGNQLFRDFVKERKNAYNLAQNKAEKARVAREVVDLVHGQNPPGRFLERESDSSTGWWIECSLAKALSKTSQALREGAPTIRAQHQKEIPSAVKTSGRKPKTATLVPPEAVQAMAHHPPLLSFPHSEPQAHQSRATIVQDQAQGDSMTEDPAEHYASLLVPLVPHREHEVTQDDEQRPWKKQRIGEKTFESESTTSSSSSSSEPNANLLSSPLLAPLISNREFEDLYGRATSNEHTPEFGNAPTPPPEVTPPLHPTRAPDMPVALSSLPPAMMGNFPAPMPRRPSELRLQRANSLALSDVSSDFAYNEFVNPFEDESYIDSLWGSADVNQRQTSTTSNSTSVIERKRMLSQTSFTELSDLGDSAFTKYQESDFSEGMKMVHDAVHPGLSSPLGREESIPTHLIPFHGSLGSTRRLSTAPAFPSRSPMQAAGSQ